MGLLSCLQITKSSVITTVNLYNGKALISMLSEIHALCLSGSTTHLKNLILHGLYFFFPFVGLFAAAHDLNLEWVIVKGISHFSNDSNTPDESWKSFASIMAASLVSNMLNDPAVFIEWPHYEGMYPPFFVCLLIVIIFQGFQ